MGLDCFGEEGGVMGNGLVVVGNKQPCCCARGAQVVGGWADGCV